MEKRLRRGLMPSSLSIFLASPSWHPLGNFCSTRKPVPLAAAERPSAGLPHWQLKSTSTEEGVVAPDERLPLGQTMVMGVQHAVAMFGATVLMPMLMGLDPNLAILMSGMGTLLFFLSPAGVCPAIWAPAPPSWGWSLQRPGLTVRVLTPT